MSAYINIIQVQEEQIAAFEEQKKGILQKFFNREIRFKADDGSEFPAWEKEKLSELLIERKTKAVKDGSHEHVSLTKEGVVPKTAQYNRDFLVKSDDKKYKITKMNDICYNPANLKFGVICRNTYGEGFFSPIYITFEITKKVIPEFMEIMVTRVDFINYALKYQEGTVYERMAVSPEDLLSIEVQIPCLEEQKKIADCLLTYNEAIQIKKDKLEVWKEIKRGLLQQMFVQRKQSDKITIKQFTIYDNDDNYFQEISTDINDVEVKRILEENNTISKQLYKLGAFPPFEKEYNNIDFSSVKFVLEYWNTSQLITLPFTTLGSKYNNEYIERSDKDTFSNWISHYKEPNERMYWISHGTWYVPIIIKSDDFPFANLQEPYQLFEGHTRLRWLKIISIYKNIALKENHLSKGTTFHTT